MLRVRGYAAMRAVRRRRRRRFWAVRKYTTAAILTAGVLFYSKVVNTFATFWWWRWVRRKTELRSGRVLDCPTMATETNSAAPVSAATPAQPVQPVVLTQPRDPGNFCGTDHVDVDDWIPKFERFAAVYRWDPTMMLANVGFYLCGTAGAWFEAHEADITSWDTCKQKLRDLFGKAVGRQRAASKELSGRAQTTTESYVTYILDVLALCHRADPNMSEEDKVSHLLKGIADDAFNILVSKDCSTIDDIIKECRRFEELKSRRVAKNFLRLPNTAATSSCEDLQPPCSQPHNNESVVRIVRREIEAASPSFLTRPSDDRPTISLIQQVVREELANVGLQPVCSLTEPRVSTIAPSPAPERFRRYRDPAQWRTQDDKPICFHCHGVGHISRYCRFRTYPPRSFPGYRRDDNHRPLQYGARDDGPYNGTPATPVRRSSRSPSPHDRRSRSPQHRRYSSPHPSGRPSSEN